MAGSFIENINLLVKKLDIIEESNEIFDENVIPVLEEIASLDLYEATQDLKKGNPVFKKYFLTTKMGYQMPINVLTQD